MNKELTDFWHHTIRELKQDWHTVEHWSARLWDDVVVFITNGQHSTELALTIFMLFVLLLTNITLMSIMIYRKPRLFLDQGIILRETFFALLFSITLYAFYSHHSIGLYTRTVLYTGLTISGLMVIFGIIRENTMDADEVKRFQDFEKLEEDEKRELEGWK